MRFAFLLLTLAALDVDAGLKSIVESKEASSYHKKKIYGAIYVHIAELLTRLESSRSLLSASARIDGRGEGRRWTP